MRRQSTTRSRAPHLFRDVRLFNAITARFPYYRGIWEHTCDASYVLNLLLSLHAN
jgi:hypothetical protein